MEQGERGWVRRTIESGAARRAETPTPSPPEAPALRTFIDQGADFDGTLRLRESLRIDSEFRGSIVSEGTVIIGESAGVEADIRAREVVICGAVVGNVVATRQLTIRPGGRLHGDVETPCLEIAKRAFFNGRTTMARPEPGSRAAPEADAPALPRRPRGGIVGAHP
jgi:cytoskeletal protein CcmA (bactofilin family)